MKFFLTNRETKAVSNLKLYIEEDLLFQKYKKEGLRNASDFDKFCYDHCEDIQCLLNVVHKIKKEK